MNIKQKLLKILKNTRQFVLPPPNLLPSKWVEENLYFPDGPLAGQKMRLFEFQKEMIDVINEGQTKIVFETSAQIGKTTILNGLLFFKSYNEPGNAGVLQATGKEVNQWLNGKIKPMLDASPIMSEVFTDRNDKSTVNNTSQMQLRNGGFIYFMSLNSPSHLRGKTLPLMLLDEVDAVETETDEGNPIVIASQRATTFQDQARVVICSTPTGKYGAIHVEYEASDQRKFHVPCPSCGHYHELVWENVKFDWGLQDGKKVPLPDTAYIECPECQHKFTDGDRSRAVKQGQWIKQNPMSDVAGFHVSRLYSPLSSIVSVVKDFKQAFETFSLSTFYNTVLGLPFDSLNEEVDHSEIEKLKTDISLTNIPDDVLFLTAGVDQQKDRLEITTLGHSEKSLYILDHRSLLTMNAETIESPVYRELLAFVKQPFKTVSGYRVPMAWVNVDSGNGTATKTIYRFCSNWTNLKAIKGSSQVEAPYVPVKITKTGGFELYMIGVNKGKTLVRELINRNTKKGIQVPVRLEISSQSVPDDYAEQLMSEELKKSGNTVRWVLKQGGVRNEGLDCLNYGYCARLQVTEKHKWHDWRKMQAKQIASLTTQDAPDEPGDDIEIDIEEHPPVIEKPPVRSTVARRPPQKKRGWL